MGFEQHFDGVKYLNKPRKEKEIFPGGQIQVTKCKRCEVRQGEKETGLWGKKEKVKRRALEGVGECSIVAAQCTIVIKVNL